jgi:hypothetical protein
MKTTLFVLSIVLVWSMSKPLLWGDSLNDTGGDSVGINTISGMAQVLGTNGGNGGPILTLHHGDSAKRNSDERNVCGGGDVRPDRVQLRWVHKESEKLFRRLFYRTDLDLDQCARSKRNRMVTPAMSPL